MPEEGGCAPEIAREQIEEFKAGCLLARQARGGGMVAARPTGLQAEEASFYQQALVLGDALADMACMWLDELERRRA